MKPILFNTDMGRAILDGRKTETRRVIKQVAMGLTYEDGSPARKPPYKPGDILYVRETWTKLYYVDPDGYTHYDQQMYYYAADGTPDITLFDADGFEEDDQRIRWHPSIHMPRDAARIFLRVKNVRVERLQGITRDGAVREGANPACAVLNFKAIWNSTVKPADRDLYGWAANPFVWVIEFERISREEVGGDA